MADQIIQTEVEASDQTVKTVRDSIPVGVSGAPIDRIPLQAGLVAMANSGIYTKRIASTDRCIRVVDIPIKGGQSVQAHCSRACVGVGDMRLCPEHDKQAFQPTQTPVAKGRVINSASIPLTKGESEELAGVSKQFARLGENVDSPPTTAASAPVPSGPVSHADKTGPEPQHDLKIYLRLDELAGGDVLAVLQARICEALDGLPCGNVRQMKQIVALQEKVTRLGNTRRKKNERITKANRAQRSTDDAAAPL